MFMSVLINIQYVPFLTAACQVKGGSNGLTELATSGRYIFITGIIIYITNTGTMAIFTQLPKRLKTKKN